MSKVGFGKNVNMSFDEAVTKVTAALQAEGFGVLTEIDVAGTLKKKIDADLPPYRILGSPATPRWPIAASPPSRRSACCCLATWWCARTIPATCASNSWTRKQCCP